jgi:hypothetical protein
VTVRLFAIRFSISEPRSVSFIPRALNSQFRR